MRSAIRLMLCAVLAATATTVLADGSGADSAAARGHDPAAADRMGADPHTPAKAADGDDVGGARGEPRRVSEQSRAQERAAEQAAIEEYNHQQFLNQIWTSE